MSFRRRVNIFVFFIVLNISYQRKCICRKFYCTTLFKRNLQLTKFLQRFTAITFCGKQYAEIGLKASKIIILMLKIKNALAQRKRFEDEKLEALLQEDSCQALSEFEESLGVDHTTVSKRLKAFGIIQKQGYWVPFLAEAERRRTASCHV